MRQVGGGHRPAVTTTDRAAVTVPHAPTYRPQTTPLLLASTAVLFTWHLSLGSDDLLMVSAASVFAIPAGTPVGAIRWSQLSDVTSASKAFFSAAGSGDGARTEVRTWSISAS